MGPGRRNGWMVLCAAVATAVAVVDALVGGALALIALLSAGPLLGSTRLGPGRTAALAAYAVLLGAGLGLPEDDFASGDHVIRVAILGALCGVAVWAAYLGDRLRSSRDQLRAILENVADGVVAQDRSGGLVFANQAAVRAVSDAVAGRFEVRDEDGRPLDPDELPARRALSGEEPEPTVVRFREHDTGEERWSLVKATPLRDEAGEVDMAISVMQDLTDRIRAQRAERFLSESSKLLSTSLDYGTTLRRVAELAVREMADWCGVDVVDENGQLDRVAVAGADAPGDAAPPEWRRPSDDAYGVLRSGRSSLGPGATMAVPMVARGRPVGVLSFVASGPRRYDSEDLLLAEELARRAAIAVDNARLFGERAYIARALQESLLPPALPEMPGVDVAARFRAAGQGNEVGGDFYDLFDTGHPDRWAVVIGDVCGKGAPAAAITALARYTLRAAAMRGLRPSAVLHVLNDAMVRQRRDEEFCTVAFGRLDRNGAGARLTVASGGHPLPFVIRADGRVQSAGAPGTLLGVTADPALADASVDLDPGDAVVLYTDGVTDARAPARVLTQADLADVLRGCKGLDAAAIAERLERAATASNGDPRAPVEPRDDVAILVLRVLGG